MLSDLKSFWNIFKREEQKAQIILVLIVALCVSNWYQYQTVMRWVARNDIQTAKIDELQRTIIADSNRFNSHLSIVEAKADTCQMERIREHKARIKKDSLFFIQTDRLYQKVNEILNQ